MNFVCIPACQSRYVRRMSVPYRGRHVPPEFLPRASHCLRPRLPASRTPHARLRYELARRSARQVRGRCLTKPDKVLRRQLSNASIVEMKCTKSNIVPAPGLEPGRPSFKGWWAANYPTPDQHTLLRINEYHDRESTIPAGPPSRYPRIPGHPRLVCYSFCARRPLMPAAAQPSILR
jgi:hypothetical protein